MEFPEKLNGKALRLADLARSKGLMIAVAESCTGGMVSTLLTRNPGSSDWFLGGVVSYDGSLKTGILNVSETTINDKGMVSVETAFEMAQGLLAVTSCTIAASVTGFAGPGGKEGDVPVGTVCFAWIDRRNGKNTLCRKFSGDRDAIRLEATDTVVDGLYRLCSL